MVVPRHGATAKFWGRFRRGLVDKGAWEAACSVRPYLGEMLDSAAAADVDAGLARLLERGTRGEDVEGPLRALLAEHEATKEVRPRA